VVFPALMLTVAVGLRYVLPLLWPPAWNKEARGPLLALLVAGLALYQGNYFFNHHLPVYRMQNWMNQPHPDGQDTLWRSLNFPEFTTIYLISRVPANAGYLRGALHYMRENIFLESLRPEELTVDYIRQLAPDRDHAFYIEPGNETLIHLLESYFYLLPPQYSKDPNLPQSMQFPLYYAPYLPGYSEEKRASLDRVPSRAFPQAIP
jgi:hypothetical protein